MLGAIVFLAVVAAAVYYYYVWLPSKDAMPGAVTFVNPITGLAKPPPSATVVIGKEPEPAPPMSAAPSPAEVAAAAAKAAAEAAALAAAAMLNPGEYLSSVSAAGSKGNQIQNNGFSLLLQGDGQLSMINRKLDLVTWRAKRFYNLDLANSPPYTAIMQPDGNFVIYDSQNRAVWDAGTHNRNPPATQVIVDENGRWLVKNSAGGVILDMRDTSSTV